MVNHLIEQRKKIISKDANGALTKVIIFTLQ